MTTSPDTDRNDSGSFEENSTPNASKQESREQLAVEMQSFDGPLDLLLALIQKNEMDIFTVSLSKITEDYLEYVRAAQKLELDLAGDFLVLAATLVLMKARALLPEEPEPDEIDQDDPLLRVRLIEEYKKFKSVAETLREQEEQVSRLHFRQTDSAEQQVEEIEFYDLNIYDLFSVFKKIIEEIGDQPLGVIAAEDWTVDEKIAELEEMLSEKQKANLTGYLRTMRAKLEVIVTFLALLELIRLRRIIARQGAEHGDIWIMRPKNLGPLPGEQEEEEHQPED